MENKKRIGFVLAGVGMVAALLFEPINGRKRRDRIGHALEPAGRPLRAVQARLSGSADREAEQGSGATLVERLQHVAVRAQGKIDIPDDESPSEPKIYADGGAARKAAASQVVERSKPRKRGKKSGSSE